MDPFWENCLHQFRAELSPLQYNNWIRPLKFDHNGAGYRLTAPNSFVLDWVRDRFLRRVEELAQQHFGEPVRFVLAIEEQDASARPESLPRSNGNGGLPPVRTGGVIPEERGSLNPQFTFANFVGGKANQLARAAGRQVAENLGTAYNPLFIYGGVGLGKTHLIEAIGNTVVQEKPNAKVRYVTSEKYVSDVVQAYQHKAFDSFKRQYHTLDLLLIDDIQFIGGKTRSQEEFFFCFNALVESRKQIIMTCDRFPQELDGIDERLKSRFAWGLSVGIEPPELEMRVAILINKAELEGETLDETVAFFIAKHIRSNVRELEGALKRVLAYTRFTGGAISLESAKEALKDLLAIQNRQISIENIQKTVADYYKLKVGEMYSKKRSRSVARPRQVAMALAKELTQLSLPDIGDAFGGRDHTTVLHACRKIAELREQDNVLQRDLSMLQQMLKG
jgi:chromosomal replication initiator protein